MRIVADVGTCEGYGMCEAMAHEFFEVSDEDETVVVLDESPAEEHRSQVHAAVESCPVQALRLDG
jgi:ferredoxin